MRKVWRALLVVVGLAVVASLLGPANHASAKVAFMGDSITQGWAFPRANFGIHGQTTAQMRARFEDQVAGHGYGKVVILGGTNDTLLGIDQETTIENLEAMVDEARAAGIEPVLGEIPPIYKEKDNTDGHLLAAARELDGKIKALGLRKGVKVVDYFDALLDQRCAYSDGVHLKRRGYLRMEWALVRVMNPFLG